MFTKIENHWSASLEAAVALGREEALKFGHAYVGTEHLLLGLIGEESGIVANVLSTFRVTGAAIRSEIERLVSPGPAQHVSSDLELTPRAKRALGIAADESRNLCQEFIGPEHLLVGLLSEGTGVAAQVLEKLGVRFDELGRQAFKTRIEQMKIVERAIRPVRASVSRKRKMREELLAHFTAIYDEELLRLHDSVAAIKEAKQRFGSPEELANELGVALPWAESGNYFMERLFGWCAPEPVARHLMHLSMLIFAAFAVASTFAAISIACCSGHGLDWFSVRVFVYLTVSAPIGQFIFGLVYFELRNSLLGAFGRKKSTPRSIALACVLGLFGFIGSLAFVAVLGWNYASATPVLMLSALGGALMGVSYWLMAWFRGPTEVRDAQWELLDLKELSTD
jgi:hypothetical protein